MNRGKASCPHCLQQVRNLGQHVRDTGGADTLSDGACPVLFALRNPELDRAAS